MSKIKGTALLPAVKMVRKFQDKLEPDSLDAEGWKLTQQRILPASWYPIEPASQVMRAVAHILGISSIAEAMEVIGSRLAEDDYHGVYGSMITVGDVGRTLRRSGVRWRNYFDTGTLSFTQPDPSKSVGTYRLEGFEAPIPYCNSIIGMARVAIRLAGSGTPSQIRELSCTLRGDPCCEFHAEWS
jgi:hypothetical protein